MTYRKKQKKNFRCEFCEKISKGMAHKKYCSPECRIESTEFVFRERQADLKSVNELEKSSW